MVISENKIVLNFNKDDILGGEVIYCMTHSSKIIFTKPSEAVTNLGYDNINGDLIVAKNDIIEEPSGLFSYEVLKFLGCGSFGQVFCVKTIEEGINKFYALKISKSQADYRNHARSEARILEYVCIFFFKKKKIKLLKLII